MWPSFGTFWTFFSKLCTREERACSSRFAIAFEARVASVETDSAASFPFKREIEGSVERKGLGSKGGEPGPSHPRREFLLSRKSRNSRGDRATDEVATKRWHATTRGYYLGATLDTFDSWATASKDAELLVADPCHVLLFWMVVDGVLECEIDQPIPTVRNQIKHVQNPKR